MHIVLSLYIHNSIFKHNCFVDYFLKVQKNLNINCLNIYNRHKKSSKVRINNVKFSQESGMSFTLQIWIPVFTCIMNLLHIEDLHVFIRSVLFLDDLDIRSVLFLDLS